MASATEIEIRLVGIVILSEDGVEHVEQLLKDHNILTDGTLYDPQNISLVHHTNQALRAHKMFSRDTDYIVKEGKVILIDEFTGRMMEGRRLSEGLHQAIEAKEGVTTGISAADRARTVTVAIDSSKGSPRPRSLLYRHSLRPAYPQRTSPSPAVFSRSGACRTRS